MNKGPGVQKRVIDSISKPGVGALSSGAGDGTPRSILKKNTGGSSAKGTP